jgi:surfeit locus 1 family protein
VRSPFHGRVFRPGVIPTLAMLPLLVVLLWLGHWQWNRAAEKQALLDHWASQALVAPVALPMARAGNAGTDSGADHGSNKWTKQGANTNASAQFQRVFATGAYLPGSQVLLDNQTHGGQAGYRVLTPLLLADGSALMVDRGWVPLPGNARDQLPDVAVSGTERRVQGRLDHFRQAALRESTAPLSPVRDNLPRVMNYPAAAAVSAAIGRPVYPLVLLLDGTEPDGFVRENSPTLSFGPERHLGYAIQWWALALTLVLLWGWTALKPKH